MKVADLMTRGVLSVGPQDPARKAAELMLRYGINGFPVLDQGKLVGMITQSDFLRRVETGTEPNPAGLAGFFGKPGRLADAYVHSHARTVADVMTREVVTVSPDTSLADAVKLMLSHQVKRLPVVSGGGVIGMISRGDLLHAYLVATQKEAPIPLDDATIAFRLKDELDHQPWIASGVIESSVDDGVVVLRGPIRDPRQRNALRVVAENIPGVKRVVDELDLASLS